LDANKLQIRHFQRAPKYNNLHSVTGNAKGEIELRAAPLLHSRKCVNIAEHHQ